MCAPGVAGVAHAGQTTFHRDLNDLSKQLDLARGPEVYATLRKIWGTGIAPIQVTWKRHTRAATRGHAFERTRARMPARCPRSAERGAEI